MARGQSGHSWLVWGPGQSLDQELWRHNQIMMRDGVGSGLEWDGPARWGPQRSMSRSPQGATHAVWPWPATLSAHAGKKLPLSSLRWYHEEEDPWKNSAYYWPAVCVMTLWHWNDFHITGFPSQWASNLEIQYFLWCYPELAVEQTIDLLVIWAAHVMSLCALMIHIFIVSKQAFKTILGRSVKLYSYPPIMLCHAMPC